MDEIRPNLSRLCGYKIPVIFAAGVQRKETADNHQRNEWSDDLGLVQRVQIAKGSNNPSTLPLLSANLSRCTPALSSSVRCKFASGVGFAYLR